MPGLADSTAFMSKHSSETRKTHTNDGLGLDVASFLLHDVKLGSSNLCSWSIFEPSSFYFFLFNLLDKNKNLQKGGKKGSGCRPCRKENARPNHQRGQFLFFFLGSFLGPFFVLSRRIGSSAAMRDDVSKPPNDGSATLRLISA